jgi:Choline/Carnitine o-acyltransferase
LPFVSTTDQCPRILQDWLVSHTNTENVFHGFDAHNRWFDKSLSIVVTNDARIGVNGEHSPCDALVPSLLVDFAVKK